MLTGNVPFKNGVTHTGGARARLALSAVTLPQYLKKAGYTSGIFGKWHLGLEEKYQPGARGFDEVFVHGYGGIGQPYTIFVFDQEQPVRYYGGNAEHLVDSRRCVAWVHEIKVQDDGGNAITKNVYIDPNSYFSGGCQLP